MYLGMQLPDLVWQRLPICIAKVRLFLNGIQQVRPIFKQDTTICCWVEPSCPLYPSVLGVRNRKTRISQAVKAITFFPTILLLIGRALENISVYVAYRVVKYIISRRLNIYKQSVACRRVPERGLATCLLSSPWPGPARVLRTAHPGQNLFLKRIVARYNVC
jgi:hypothetical protein